jgi:hypothetical protein
MLKSSLSDSILNSSVRYTVVGPVRSLIQSLVQSLSGTAQPGLLPTDGSTAIKISGWRIMTLLQLLLGKYHLPYLKEEGKCHQENGYCSEYNKNLVVPEDIPRCNVSAIIQQCSHVLRLMLFYELL